ncbi:IS3 family transposase [Thalassotalea sp. LPB0316]|uniref:IS3 family transposase n=1 Tax=Thalassotalea sp. LPB0316 TaxID=2769490 RepID=UPI001D0439B9|nr:IS3 family transposase [Thalassotalea sp. LPB0316]
MRTPGDTLHLCKLLDVSSSGFYAYFKRGTSKRDASNAELLRAIDKIIQISEGAFGYRQIHEQLLAEGYQASPNRVQRLLQAQHYRAVMSRKQKRYPKVSRINTRPNLLNREFLPKSVNQVWATDITQVYCREGWLYVCVIIDLYSRAVLGYSQGRAATSDLVKKAYLNAKRFSKLSNLNGVLCHSDQGSQYKSDLIVRWLNAQGAIISMSRKGNCWDNACVESFFSLMKQQWLHPQGVQPLKYMSQRVTGYIENIYNRFRVHGTHGEVPLARYLRES